MRPRHFGRWNWSGGSGAALAGDDSEGWAVRNRPVWLWSGSMGPQYEIAPSGFGLGAWGRIVSRGSSIGDYVSTATVVIDGRAKSCAASWSIELAKSMVTGPWARVAAFSGWIEMPNLSLGKCTGGDTLEVSVRLVGESNRGSIDVDWFGISARRDDDVNRVFALRPKSDAPKRSAHSP